MSVYPPPQPAYGPPPPGHGPQRPPSRGNANGFLAAAVAGIVIVVGIVATVLLVTSDGNKDVRASLGSGSNRPTGSQRSQPTGRPTGPTVPGANLAAATSAGTTYFSFLGSQLYFASRGKWCDPSAFPLSQDDVYSVASSYALGSAQGGSSLASMRGHISLDDGRSGSVTITLRPVDSTGSTWCITSQSGLS